jgi:hypothetical protein
MSLFISFIDTIFECIVSSFTQSKHPDMTKALDRGMTMTDVHLLGKHGGKSGSCADG